MKKSFLTVILLCITLLCNASGGPYPMFYETPIEDDECKVVVPSSQGGNVVIINVSTNEAFTIMASATYFNIWYYVIPKGIYRICSITNGFSVNSQGIDVSVGDTVDFSNGGYITISLNS